MLLKTVLLSLLAIFGASHAVLAAKFDCTSLPMKPIIEKTFSATPTADFSFRSTLPQTEKPITQWSTCCGSYGPCALPYPKVIFFAHANVLIWSRIRVVEAAKKFIGLPYGHHHIPLMGGIDCSNFTAFVYNYAFGIRFTSSVEKQSLEVGRRLNDFEALMPGDLIFLYSDNRSRISHVAIYISPTEIIDSTGPGVQLRPFGGWYKRNYAWARRMIE